MNNKQKPSAPETYLKCLHYLESYIKGLTEKSMETMETYIDGEHLILHLVWNNE